MCTFHTRGCIFDQAHALKLKHTAHSCEALSNSDKADAIAVAIDSALSSLTTPTPTSRMMTRRRKKRSKPSAFLFAAWGNGRMVGETKQRVGFAVQSNSIQFRLSIKQTEELTYRLVVLMVQEILRFIETLFLSNLVDMLS
jgi:hypothetical protein